MSWVAWRPFYKEWVIITVFLGLVILCILHVPLTHISSSRSPHLTTGSIPRPQRNLTLMRPSATLSLDVL